jgi:hypothetical protein
MSYVANKTHGYNSVASAVTFDRETLTLAADGLVPGRTIATLGMPRITLWARQANGAFPGQFSLQFSIADSGGVHEWLDLTPGIAAPLGVPILQQFTIPAKFIRIVAQRFPGQPSSIEFALMAAL